MTDCPPDSPVCLQCGSVNNIQTLQLKNRGLGSAFEGLTLDFTFCESCLPADFAFWCQETPQLIEGIESYRYESQILTTIASFPLECQALIWYTQAKEGPFVTAEDWIAAMNETRAQTESHPMAFNPADIPDLIPPRFSHLLLQAQLIKHRLIRENTSH